MILFHSRSLPVKTRLYFLSKEKTIIDWNVDITNEPILAKKMKLLTVNHRHSSLDSVTQCFSLSLYISRLHETSHQFVYSNEMPDLISDKDNDVLSSIDVSTSDEKKFGNLHNLCHVASEVFF